MRKIIIAGGSGFLGRNLAAYFSDKGYKVVVLSRQNRIDDRGISYVKWDGKTGGAWIKTLNGAEAVVNLTGRSVDCRYTEINRQEIYDSRINATYVLGQAISYVDDPPKVWINASSATIYRHAMDKEMDEVAGELGTGFSVDVCKKWEDSFFESTAVRIRKVALRIAIVLSSDGGALKPLLDLVRLGFGGAQGTGKQFFSWLHISDFVRIVEFIIDNEELDGVYNASAPYPLPNDDFMQKLRKVSGVRFGFPIRRFLLEMGAFLIRTETELLLKSRRVIPGRLMKSGFKFRYNYADEALKDLIAK